MAECLRMSEGALLCRFSSSITFDDHLKVRALFELISARQHDAITALHPAYSSLVVEFDPRAIAYASLEALVIRLAEEAPAVSLASSREVEIPVCYEGPDLDEVAKLVGLSTEKVIELHSGAEYFVYFLGFQPGFAYLGGLPDALRVPRLDTPRVRVPEGSVAIAGGQAGIYPRVSPGGWRLIGQTRTKLFDAGAPQPCLLEMGTRVRFRRD